MTSLPISSCLFLWLLGLAFSQESPPKPKRPPRPSRDGSGERLEPLVKLPDDFVQFARVPDEGRLPRVGIGKEDLALLYFKGDETQGDLFLARSSDEAKTFSPALRVNAVPGSVAVVGSTHTGAVDVGPDGRAHVAWISRGETPALHYLHEVPENGPAPVQDLGAPAGLCSTPAVTVDAEGRVYLFYAALGAELDRDGAPMRRIFMRRSADGTSFEEAVPIDKGTVSVSGESAIAAHVDEVMGTVFVFYRTASLLKPGNPALSRGMCLLASENDGVDFESTMADNHKHARDPASSATLTQQKDTTLATWDGAGHVYWSTIRRQLNRVSLPAEAKGERPARRFQAAGAASGSEVLVAWLEQPTADRAAPPRVAWRVWLRESHTPLGDGFAAEAPGSSAPVVVPRRAGGFTILF